MCMNTQQRWSYLYCVFTYIYSLLTKKGILDCRNLSVNLPCVYVWLSSGDLFIFSEVFTLYSYFFYYPYFPFTRGTYNVETQSTAHWGPGPANLLLGSRTLSRRSSNQFSDDVWSSLRVPEAVVPYLRRNNCYISVATQIPHDAGLLHIP